MNKVIIPGFGTNIELFKDFMKLSGKTDFVDLEDHTYVLIEKKLGGIFEKKGKLNIFGWSLGSLFALKWAIKNPDKVNSLFLTGATARFCEKENYENNVSQKKLKQMIVLLARKPGIVMNEFYKSILEYSESKNKYFKILHDNKPDPGFLKNGLKEFNEIDLLDEIVNIKVPVFIYQGKYDSITTLKGADYIQNKIKNARLEVYKGGHCSFIENPDQCEKYWKEFLCTVC